MPDIEYWRLMGKLGAFELHARYNAKELTKNARAAAFRRFHAWRSSACGLMG